jgi:CheY-like chemotaxis protein
VGPNGRRYRVLVVDDNDQLRKSYVRSLKGCDVVEACSGREAARILAEDEAFDVIVSDFQMPDWDGAQLHWHLSRKQPHLVSRVLFVTGCPGDPFFGTCDNTVLMKGGSFDYIEELIREIAEVHEQQEETDSGRPN